MMEQIVLNNEILRIHVCPALGGKITSVYLKSKDFELAAQCNKNHYALKDAAWKKRDYFAYYAYGMDDAFPNIDEEKIEWNHRLLFYPDHGEIWKAQFEVVKLSPERISLSWRSTEFQYLFSKDMWLKGETLRIRYHIKNEGKEDFPCMWTWHGLVKYEKDMEFLLPEDLTHYRNVLDGSILGEEGQVYSFHNNVYDFQRISNRTIGNMVKYYGDKSTKIGYCGVYYPSKDVLYYLSYDAYKLPYLGVWITVGGFQGDYNCALEPSNGYYDSIGKASKNNKLPVLRKGESLDFVIGLSLQARNDL